MSDEIVESGELDENETIEPEKKRKNPMKAPHIQAAIDKRREIVASLAARGMRQTEIHAQLASRIVKRKVGDVMKEFENPSYLVNPETQEPFDKATISRDVKALRAEWRKSSKVDSDDYFGGQLAEIEEMKRRMWVKDDMWGVARALELEIKLTGSARPQKLEHRWDDKQIGKVDKMAELFKLMREREVMAKSGDDES